MSTMANEPVSAGFKLYCLSVMTLVAAAESGSSSRLQASLVEHVFNSPKELLKLSVPSVVYAVQNNMAFLALSNLDAAVYQWFSIFLLCAGVTLVQWKPVEATKVQIEQKPVVGFIAIAVAVICSGFAGIAVTLLGVYVTDGAKVMEKGFFFGYTPWVCFVVFLASVGGLYTSVVVKYTDNIMKGFSAAAAIVISTVASVILFGLQITVTFASGALMVCVSIYLYGLPKKDTSKLPGKSIDETESKQKLITV
ncbi:hypothetical protein CRUP_027952 [Coryphaenoides rupestris]|nr:hypothetical protein CRUP_027952 [Coryphaenoides rupestris]